MDKKRAGLDLTDFKPKNKDSQIKHVNNDIEEIGAELGFVRREVTKQRRKRKSPYQAQANIKCREGIKELFQVIGDKLDVYDHTTFERAILALIEKEKLKDLEARYHEVLEKKISKS